MSQVNKERPGALSPLPRIPAAMSRTLALASAKCFTAALSSYAAICHSTLPVSLGPLIDCLSSSRCHRPDGLASLLHPSYKLCGHVSSYIMKPMQDVATEVPAGGRSVWPHMQSVAFGFHQRLQSLYFFCSINPSLVRMGFQYLASGKLSLLPAAAGMAFIFRPRFVWACSTLHSASYIGCSRCTACQGSPTSCTLSGLACRRPAPLALEAWPPILTAMSSTPSSCFR